jgi:hypothetical protein
MWALHDPIYIKYKNRKDFSISGQQCGGGAAEEEDARE